MRILPPILLLLLLSCGAGSAQEVRVPPIPVEEHVLKNGLRLLILPRPGALTVSFVTQYRIGSVNEEPGSTGISHFLEHLLFKGTTSIGTSDYRAEAPILAAMDQVADSLEGARNSPDLFPGREIRGLEERFAALREEAGRYVVRNEFDAIYTENGARGLNASTAYEATTYYVELPANRAELWFAMEADRMRNPVFREFYAERDVVAEERRMRMESNPAGALHQAHLGQAFRAHPYGRPVIGTMEDIQKLTRKRVQEHYRRYYGPNNAVVAVVGGIDSGQALRWAREYLGQLPRGETPPEVRVVEPPQKEERRVRVAFDAEPSLRIGWKVPSTLDQDAPALAMLASILTGGRSSRLYRRLVLEDRVATGVTSGPGPGYLHPGLFTIDASPRAPNTPGEVEEIIYQELDRLRKAPPEDRELLRVRNQLEAARVRRLRSNFGLAAQMAESASLFGDWRRSFQFAEAMEAVTPREIQRVIRAYFNPEGRTVAILERGAEEDRGGIVENRPPGPGGAR